METVTVPDFSRLLAVIAQEPMAWLALGVTLLALAYGGMALAGARPWSRMPDALSLRHRPLHVHVVLAAIGAFTLPVTIAGLGGFAWDLWKSEREVESALTADARRVAIAFDDSVERRVLRLLAVADALANDPPRDVRQLEQRLVRHLQANLDTSTMIVTDPAGVLRAVARREQPGAEARPFAFPVGERVDDREYFRVAMRDGRPFVSGMFRGRALGQHEIMVVAVPYGPRARPQGIVQISVTAETLGVQVAKWLSDPKVGFALTDAEGATAAAGGPSERSPWFRVAQRTARGWSLELQRGFAAEIDGARARFRAQFAALTLGGFIAVALIALLVRRITRPLARLARAMSELDPADDAPPPVVSRFAPRETRTLFAEFSRAARRLRQSHDSLRGALAEEKRLRGELARTVAEREAVIAQRTAELSAANLSLRDLSRTDELTGLANRRALREQLEGAARMAQRVARPIAVLVIDVDHFKAFNDRYGHPAGDACLREVADALRRNARRTTDLCARYGGEEFMLVLPLTDRTLAGEIAEAARRSVRELRIPHEGSAAGVVTISIGVAAAVPDEAAGAEALIQAADQALYQAKRGGRDRVVLALAPP